VNKTGTIDLTPAALAADARAAANGAPLPAAHPQSLLDGVARVMNFLLPCTVDVRRGGYHVILRKR
jgi:hypothetical protein